MAKFNYDSGVAYAKEEGRKERIKGRKKTTVQMMAEKPRKKRMPKE